jgi:RHS repeat-associated protein
VWDRDAVLHELGEGAEPVSWIFHPELPELLGKLEGETGYAATGDHLGTPEALRDRNGALAWRMQLDLYGVSRGPAEKAVTACPHRFPGQYEDEETGLCYNRFRYYDPEAGRYLTPDPLGLAGGFDPYGYVPNPLRQIDPLGLACEETDNVAAVAFGWDWLVGSFTQSTGVFDDNLLLPWLMSKVGSVEEGAWIAGHWTKSVLALLEEPDAKILFLVQNLDSGPARRATAEEMNAARALFESEGPGIVGGELDTTARMQSEFESRPLTTLDYLLYNVLRNRAAYDRTTFMTLMEVPVKGGSRFVPLDEKTIKNLGLSFIEDESYAPPDWRPPPGWKP